MSIKEVHDILKEHNINVLSEKNIQNEKTIRIVLSNETNVILFENGDFRITGKNRVLVQKLFDDYDSLNRLDFFKKTFNKFLSDATFQGKDFLKFLGISAVGGIVGNRADNEIVEALNSKPDSDEKDGQKKFDLIVRIEVNSIDKNLSILTCSSVNFFSEIKVKLIIEKDISKTSEWYLSDLEDVKKFKLNIDMDSVFSEKVEFIGSNLIENELYFSSNFHFRNNNIEINLVSINEKDLKIIKSLIDISYVLTGKPENLIAILLRLPLLRFNEETLIGFAKFFFTQIIIEMIKIKISQDLLRNEDFPDSFLELT